MGLSKKEEELVTTLIKEYGSKAGDVVQLMMDWQYNIFSVSYCSLQRVEFEIESLIYDKANDKR